MNILIIIAAWIDWALYSLASAMFDVIKQISVTSFFDENHIEAIANRVYVIVGVLMLFKLVVSAIQYLVNPDSMDDKEKGLFGILKNSIITVGLIVLVPVVFEFAMDLQTTLVESLPTIIFGAQGDTVKNDKSTGETLSYTVLASFVKDKGKGGSIGAIGDTSSTIHDITTYRDHLSDGCGFSNTDNCHYEFMPLISTIAGAFLIYILLSMALDVAMRTIKLGIIQMLAPIPISSYVIKKDNFNKFVKISLQVYGDLFIRMSIVYFIIFALQELTASGILDPFNITGNSISNSGNWFVDVLVNITLIFGLLMFAKSAPKFITDLLGLPEITGGDLADMFKPAWQRAGGAARALINPFRNAVSAGLNSYGQADNLRGKNPVWRGIKRGIRTTGAVLRGAATGTLDSVQGVAAGDDWNKMRERGINRDAADFRRANRAHRYRTMSRTEAFQARAREHFGQVQSFFGYTPVTSSGYSDAASKLETFRNEALIGRAISEMKKDGHKLEGYSAKANQLGLSTMHGFHAISDTFEYEGRRVSFADVNNLGLRLDSGQAISQAELRHLGVKDISEFKAMREKVEKSAGAEYVDVAVQAQRMLDDRSITLTDEQRKYLTSIADQQVVSRVNIFREAIGSLNIPASEKSMLFKELEEHPGAFLARGNDIIAHYRDEAARRAKYEAPQSGGKN